MEDDFSDIQFLKDNYALAREKYKPSTIRFLMVGESPPCTLDRYFYFEDVKKQDSMFLETMGVLYPELKQRYLKSGRETSLKADLLESFKEDGFWLLNLAEVPTELLEGTLESCVSSLLTRLEKYISKTTPIILIKASVYDLCYGPLTAAGYNVVNERIPFPGSGQQGVFREKFSRVVNGG